MPRSSVTYDIDGGVHCANFIGGDQHITYGFSAADVEKIIQKMLDFLAAGATILPRSDGSLGAEWDGQSLIFHPRAAHTLAGQRSERSYLLSLTLHKDYLEWAANFIPLKADVEVIEQKRLISALDIPLAYLAVRQPPPGAGPEAQVTTEPLENITEALTRHDAFIILGEPGCGKTTTLQKMAYEHAMIRLKDQSGLLPLFVRLSQQHNDAPFAFLEKIWAQRTGTSLADALSAERVLLLLDGVNELPRDEYLPQRLNDWRVFAEEYGGASKVVFTGREKDYGGHLDLPRVLVRPLDEERIAAYLRRNQAEGLLEVLQKASPDARRRMQDLAENPLHLNMLAHYYRENHASLDNRGELFCWFATALIAREKIYHPENDPQDIPMDVRTSALAHLAFSIQEKKLGTVIRMPDAQELAPKSIVYLGKKYRIDAEELFRFARGARVLDPTMEADIRFQHQMLHEFFAAVELLRRFQAGEDSSHLWVSPRLNEDMPQAEVGVWDPLPEPPATGWEVTTILACGLATEPAKLVETVRRANPTLAGRCLDEAGIHVTASPAVEIESGLHAVRQAVQQDLLTDLYDPHVHLRARLQAGFVLGRIGDPRFMRQEVNGIQLILPQMVPVPAGKYRIGSPTDEQDAFEDESPPTWVELPDFAIGKWPLTNAEYACFMAAGGYENEACWQGDLARRWLKGEEVTGGQFKSWLDAWEALKSLPDVRAALEQSGNFTPQQIDTYVYIAGLSEEELKAELGKSLQQKSRRQPAYWDDPKYNSPSQPVVGVTWFEANAYCAWLSALTGRDYRLPSEAEWEAAARAPVPLTPSPLPGLGKGRRGKGGEVRAYPWGGDWDTAKANTLEGRVLRPSPVGVYAAGGGAGPFGTEDQAGNVWNWTSSLYRPYPYDPMQSEQSEAEGERVLRGGSWGSDRGFARCAYRDRYVPDNFTDVIGFRLLSPGIFLDSAC